MAENTKNFVNAMLDSAKKTEETKAEKGADVDPEEVEDLLKMIQEKLQKK